MSRNPPPGMDQLTLNQAARYIICYVVWILFLIIGGLIVLRLLINIADVSFLLGADRYTRGLVDKIGIYILGLLWIILVFWTEAYLRKGVMLNLLWPRIQQVMLIEAGLLGASFGLQWLFTRFVS